MVRPAKPVKDPTLKEWLDEFKKEKTQKAYLSALRAFKKNLKIKDLDEYLKSNPDGSADIRRFTVSLKGKASMTVKQYVTAVRVFFQDHNVDMKKNEWKKLRRRGFIPKRAKAETRDKKPTKPQLKKILNYGDIKLRALTLFLSSSGARIGESLQLLEEDFDFEADPPRVHIRAEYTKADMGERTAYFSYEARDAIEDWLQIKDTLKKRNGVPYKDDQVFFFSVSTARLMWNRACDKAGIGVKDKHTNRRIYHLHSLRKYFRTKIGLDLDITHALMGHTEYLDDSYLRLEEEGEIAKAYLEAMPNVSVYQVETPEIKDLEEENEELTNRILKTEAKLAQIEKLLVEVLNGKNT